jgi:hypothetical protein
MASLRVFLVLGMHRGGTSATAGALHHAGASAGEGLIGPTENNLAGYFESRAEVKEMEALLRACGSFWNDWRPLRMATADPGILEGSRARLKAQVEARLAQSPVITLKDPRHARAVGFWRALLAEVGAEAVAVHPVRHPVAVWRSLEARNGMDMGSAGRLWLRHMLDAERGSRGMARLFVHYETLLADPTEMLERAGALAGMRWEAKGLERAKAHMNPALHRQAADVDGQAAMDALLPLVGQASAILTRYAHDRIADGAEPELDDLTQAFAHETAPFEAHFGARELERLGMQKRARKLEARLESRTPLWFGEGGPGPHPPAMVELADLLGKAGEDALAGAMLERALALDPTQLQSVLEKAEIARRSGREAQANTIVAACRSLAARTD